MYKVSTHWLFGLAQRARALMTHVANKESTYVLELVTHQESSIGRLYN